MQLLDRSALAALTRALDTFPAVCLVGPRQVGKTTLAHAVTDLLGPERATYLDLELPSDRSRIADPETWLEAQAHRVVVLDEIQRVPALFEVLRAVIDRRRRVGERSGLFLLLGSASIQLLRQSSESLAGRITFIELTPLHAEEIPASPGALDRLWVRGGFPDSFLAASDEESRRWREAFIATYLERDIPQLGPRIPAETLRRFWTMLAHEQGGQLNAARLAAALGVSGQTIVRYVDLLVDLLLVRRLAPWAGNVGKRLVRAPRIFVRDSGLAHALLGLETLDDVLGHPVAGHSWEGLVIESLLAEHEGAAYYYRTAAGAEIDLVLEDRRGALQAIEVKRSSAPTPGRGFVQACDDLGVTRRLIVYPGTHRYPLPHGVEACGLREAIRFVRGPDGALASDP